MAETSLLKCVAVVFCGAWRFSLFAHQAIPSYAAQIKLQPVIATLRIMLPMVPSRIVAALPLLAMVFMTRLGPARTFLAPVRPLRATGGVAAIRTPTLAGLDVIAPLTVRTPSTVVKEEGSIWDTFQEIFIEEGNQTQRLLMQAVPYFYFRHELGIAEEKMYRIAISYGNVLGMNLSMLKQKLEFLKAELGLTQPEVVKMVETYPSILLRNVEVVVPPTVAWLRTHLGLDKDDEGRPDPQQLRELLLSCPSILIASTPKLQQSMDYLETEFCLNRRQVRKVVLGAPYSLTTGLVGMKNKVDFLKCDLGLQDSEVRSLVLGTPSLLVRSMETILDHIEYLTGEVHLPVSVLRRVLLKSPTLLLQNLDKSIRPKVDFLRNELKMNRDEVIKAIRLVPRIFNYDFNRRTLPFYITIQNPPFRFTKLQIRKMILRSPALINLDTSSERFADLITTLREVTCGTDKELSTLVKLFPQVLSFTSERIRSHVDFLQDYLSLPRTDIATLIRKHPQLLGYRLEAIHTKIDLVMAMLDIDEEATRKVILAHPVLLSLSTTKRIRPRLEQANQLGMSNERALASLMYPNDKFEALVERTAKALEEEADLQSKTD